LPKVHKEKKKIGRPKNKSHKHDLDPIREYVKQEERKTKLKKQELNDEQVETTSY